MAKDRGTGLKEIFQKAYTLGIFSVLSSHLSKAQKKVFEAIRQCRTINMGGHVDKCIICNHTHISYNSCRDRHCPLCGGLSKERWLSRMLGMVLDVQHLHMVFTVPQELNRIALANKPLFYNLLFKASRDAVMEYCTSRDFTPGFTSVLHSWGQNLSFHPHIHLVITAGGLSSNGKWVRRMDKKGRAYLAPVRVLSRLFRGKLVSMLRAAHSEGRLVFDAKAFSSILSDAMEKEWCVYSKEPFHGSQCVYKYLGRYTHRTAISNSRILSLTEESVSFKWRDYSDGNKEKVMVLSIEEFIRRFLMHVLENGFTRIRHYGLYAQAAKKKRLKAAELTGTELNEITEESTAELIMRICGIDIYTCPVCGAPLVSGSLLDYHLGRIP